MSISSGLHVDLAQHPLYSFHDNLDVGMPGLLNGRRIVGYSTACHESVTVSHAAEQVAVLPDEVLQGLE